MPLPIAQLGQPVLRQVAAPVSPEEIPSPEFQAFLQAMRETLEEANGAGLAAPQVFVSRRVFLARLGAAEDPPEVLINPVLSLDGQVVFAWEGCLSFPELLVRVPRASVARIEFLDDDAQPRSLELTEFPARVVQHEFDHLEGILTIDRAPTTLDIIKASEVDVLRPPESEAEG
jgi:peptide deformylase